MSEIKLVEILHHKMDILFVALNPPEISNRNGRFFSGSLSFWNLLYDSGLIAQRVETALTGEDEVFRDNAISYRKSVFGITDLCHDILETKSSRVKVSTERVKRILGILERYEIKILCLMHQKVGKAFGVIPTLDRNKKYGHIGNIGNVRVLEMPFHNASKITNKYIEYNKLLTHL